MLEQHKAQIGPDPSPVFVQQFLKDANIIVGRSKSAADAIKTKSFKGDCNKFL